MTPLYISFFTPKYAESAGELRQTLDRFELEHELKALDDINDCGTSSDKWVANVQRKPGFVLSMMKKHPGRPLVWLDADARVRQMPRLFQELADGHVDFACHWLGGCELLSGTLFFGGTEAAHKLVKQWVSHQAAHKHMVDQVSLERVMAGAPQRMPAWLLAKILPAEYVAIFDHDMCEEKKWVISHHQYSRRFRFAEVEAARG